MSAATRHDLAVVDVGPALLEPLLGNLRASKEHAEIPVLVEQSRIAAGLWRECCRNIARCRAAMMS